MPSDPQSPASPRSSIFRRGTVVAVAMVVFMVLGGYVMPRWLGSVLMPRPPSVIFVLVDTLRADYLGAYGFDGPVSPNLDRLAGESVLFERAFAQAPWTKPSIASLFTSLAPETHRVLTHDGKYGAEDESTGALPQEATTLAESFAKAGYATAAFVANPWMLREHGFAQGFDVWDQRQGLGLPPRAAVLFAAARKWLAGRDRDQPFFLYLHLMDVHGPYNAPDADYAAVRDSAGLGPDRALTPDEKAQLRPYLLRAPWVAQGGGDRLRTWRARYAAGVHAMDRQLGGFLAELARSGVLDDAIVVVTADHGEELADHGGWDHGFRLYDHQLRVPLLVRLPGGEDGGGRVGEVVSLIDLMPTLLKQGGIAAPVGVQGRDLSPLLAGSGAQPPAGVSFAGGVKWNPAMRSLRSPEWKLIEDGGAGATQLFDVARDPGEQRDLAAARPAERRALAAELAAHQQKLAASPALAREQAEVSDEMKQRLEALGYAD